MNAFLLLFFIYYAIIFLIVAIPILLIILWAINKWVLKKKTRLVYKILLSIGVPLVLVGVVFADLYFEPYSTSEMDDRLAHDRVDIKLPAYRIVKYKSKYVGGDDFEEIYQIKFKGDIDKSLI